MPTLEQLQQRHPSLDCVEIAQLRAMYEGGKAFRKQLTSFLPRRPHEPMTFYKTRLKESVYRNYVAPTIDYFNALLFSSRPKVAVTTLKGAPAEVDEYYGRFREDSDKTGRDVDAVFKAALTDAMVTRCSWIRLHQPSTPEEGEPATLADFERARLGDAWITMHTAEEVIDWEVDQDGNLAWALIYSTHTRREGLEDGRGAVTERWEHLLPDRVDTYEITYKKGEQPKADASVPHIGSAPHRFGAVPLVSIDLPIGLWVSNRLESPQLGHFRLTNAQQWGLFATCYAQPLFKLKDMTNTPTMGAGYGIYLGAEESMEWIAPPSTPYESLGDAIREHKDEIFRIVQNMALGVDNNAAAVGRSAESKAADAQATRVVMLAYSRIVKEAIERVYVMISRSRGEELAWSIEGLDDFAAADVGSLVDVLARVETDAGGIPSETFQAEVRIRIAEAMLDMDQALKTKVESEIRTGVKAAADAKAKAAEVAAKPINPGAQDGAEGDIE